MATNTSIPGRRKAITLSKFGRHLPPRQPAAEAQRVLQTKTDQAAAVASELKVEQDSCASRKVTPGCDGPGSTSTTVNNGEAPTGNSSALGDLAAATASSNEVDGTILPHPLADIFPALDDDALLALAQDIGAHGLRDNIVLYQGKILDGRCRYRACEIAGVIPSVTQYAGDNPLAFVVSRNLHRRHLNESQRAMVAARLANLQRGANQHSEGMPIGRAAELLNTSERSVARAREVLAHGNPELVEAVESGKLAVSAAAALADDNAVLSDAARSIDSPTASADEGATPVEEPFPSASTMVGAAPVQVESPLFATPPLGEVTWRPAFELPMSGVTFLVGGLTAAVLEVAVKIGATVSAGGEWPSYWYTETGDVVWLSSQSGAEAILHRQLEAAAACMPRIRFLEPKEDDFGLSIRNLSEDFSRLDHEIAKEGPVKAVVLDYFSEYFRFDDTGQTIRSLQHATDALHEFAVKHGAVVVLPCQLPTRDDDAVAKSVIDFGSLQGVNAVFLIKRGVKPNRGTLVHVKENVGLDAPGFSFQLRNRNCVPTVVWDRPPRHWF
jgi:hypothetical protein